VYYAGKKSFLLTLQQPYRLLYFFFSKIVKIELDFTIKFTMFLDSEKTLEI